MAEAFPRAIRKPTQSTQSTPATQSTQASSAVSTPEKAPPMLRWEAKYPIVTSLDDDSIPDLVGYFEGDEDIYYLAALSGEDGRVLWRSDAIPGLSGRDEPRLYLGAATAFAAGSSGELTAYSRRDGGTLWTIRLAEVVEGLHVAEPIGKGEVVTVVLKDGSHVLVGLERGGLLPALSTETPLGPELPSSAGDQRGRASAFSGMSRGLRFGDVASQFEVHADDDSFHLSLGKRSKGTSVPVLVRFSQTGDVSRPTVEEIWSTPVAGVEPLQSRVPSGFATCVHADAEYACVAYVRADARSPTPSRLAAFAMGDGRRLWDEPLAEGAHLTSVTVVGDRVYLVTWKGLTVIDAESGGTIFDVAKIPE